VVDEETLAFEAIKDVGPAGHFFATQHTLDRYKTAFYEPLISDWRNFELWEESGSKTATERANSIWKRLLDEYEKPPIDPAIEEALQAYMARRREQENPR
ncbi:MAG: methyltransferase, partial [Gammaproteobacteria bacterium]|nr:methyltransferase [Gammaproteobacteria bacterium]